MQGLMYDSCMKFYNVASVHKISSETLFQLEIRAGTRNPDIEKAKALNNLPGVTVMKAKMGDKESMTEALKG